MLVLNEKDQKLGHLRKEMAAKFSTLLRSITGKNLTTEGQVTGYGDGYTQPARVKIVKISSDAQQQQQQQEKQAASTTVESGDT